MEPDNGTPTRHQYRTTSVYQLDDRRLLLRGGALDGQRWVGVVGVGKRVFCGEEPWSTAGVYLVTAEVVDDDGKLANIAIPAFAAEQAAGAAST
jgi:hypothetical protein